MIIELRPSDFDELAAAQRGWDTRYRPLKREGFNGRILSLRTDAIQIDMERFGTPMEIAGSAPPSGLSCVLPFRESNAYSSCGKVVTSSHVDVFGPGQEVFALTPQATHWLCISFLGNFVESQSNSPLMMSLMDHQQTHTILRSDSNVLQLLRNQCFKAVSLYRRGLIEDGSAKHILDEIALHATRALNGYKETPTKNASRQYRLARRARDFMLDKTSDPPTIPEICTALSTPERTLHNAFSKVYGVTPKHFLKTQRLLAVRQILQDPGQARSVSDIAMRFGFYELGYFARDYRTMFGESPSATLNHR